MSFYFRFLISEFTITPQREYKDERYYQSDLNWLFNELFQEFQHHSLLELEVQGQDSIILNPKQSKWTFILVPKVNMSVLQQCNTMQHHLIDLNVN